MVLRPPPRSGGLSHEADLDLAAKAAAGDVAAFTALVRRHERRVRAFLARVTRGEGADDLAQETFLKAWRVASSYRGEGSYEGWLLRIAWRQFLSSRRKRTEAPAEPVERADEAAGSPDARIDVERALARLAPREQAAATLCLGEGYSHAEAAGILDLPLGTLKSIVARAKGALAKQLEGQAP
ncbi:MAG: RNA polymerase sigma factor [Allosphingosinicella sp.]